jgi:Flp pilus assembly protein TadG
VVLEWVVLFPAILLLIFGTVQTGLHFHARTIASAAASEGVHAGSTTTGSTAAAVAAAQQFITDAGDGMFTDSTVEVQRTATTVTVTVRGYSLGLLPGVSTPTIRQTISGPIERPPA